MHPKSTLEGVQITPERRSGNTTRIVDNAIQMLFAGETIIVMDHHKHGEDKSSNRNLAQSIRRRMSYEHNSTINSETTADGIIMSLNNKRQHEMAVYKFIELTDQ